MTATAHAVVNGAFVRRTDAHVSIDDLGLLVGDGAFETIAVRDGVALFFDAHLERLAQGLELLQLGAAFDAAMLRAHVQRLLEADAPPAGTARLRITVTRGPGAPPAAPRAGATVVVTLDSWTPRADIAAGVGIEVSQRLREPHPLHAIKSTSYSPSLWLRREATRADTFEVLQRNTRGDLAEGSFTNVFLVDAAGTLRTPVPQDGCLPGVTRGVVLELARGAGLDCRVGAVAATSVAAAREMFLTASLVGVVPVRTVDGVALAGPCPGPVTAALQAAYAARERRASALPVPHRSAHGS
jgi:branched-subunit amino acid aminotransferase/4-amino-4-deoxychorismate lyase